ncbi:ADP-ribosylglycohydrolase family protein [Streptomyces sp. NBC_01381]|uniref:ADP-ribosylglycohydrolase family protein n=1 Tax=Streptomyces sp. NBC_01381 TaxID=2903845 RepID=UPI002257B4B6|nr:ADP-ribosylglycohydrolase family protein [Streptomyces sp. NBC_01381]MCX4667880.1 ADP-ribosylglycohydrolase family protein [Streptomyces sp. NBC_01381]
MIRLTWVQPEDLIAHELRQSEEEGRDTTTIQTRWLAAGGTLPPPQAGASPTPASPHLRALAEHLLTELTAPPQLWAGVPQGGTGGHNANLRAPTEQAQGVTRNRLHAAWLGRAAGCLLGKPVEKLPLAGIRSLAKATGNWPLNTWFTAEGVPQDLKQAYPWNKRSAKTSLAENITGMPEDDDLNYPLLNLRLLQRHGKTFTTTDVARLWLDELPAARTFTAERIAYRNLLNGIEPPHTATHHNPFREWIGALIRADVHGWTNPGAPAKAAEQAHRDAALTHTANGVYGAMFAAATIAEAAAGTDDVHHCLRTGLTVVPEDSRLARAVRHGIQLAREQRHFDHVVDELHATYGHYHWVHVVPNAALLAAALTHAEGDFTGSITRAVSGGWDTDSNGATAGSIAGLLAGHPDALPDRWTSPLENRLATSVTGFDGIGFDTLADLTTELAHETNTANTANTTHAADPTHAPQEIPHP